MKKIAAFMTTFFLFSLLLMATSIKRVNVLSIRCKNGNQKACLKLAKIAKSDKDYEIRLLAVKSIQDDKLLFEIAKNVEYGKHIRVTAISMIKDHKVLKELLKETSDCYLRNAVEAFLNSINKHSWPFVSNALGTTIDGGVGRKRYPPGSYSFSVGYYWPKRYIVGKTIPKDGKYYRIDKLVNERGKDVILQAHLEPKTCYEIVWGSNKARIYKSGCPPIVREEWDIDYIIKTACDEKNESWRILAIEDPRLKDEILSLKNSSSLKEIFNNAQSDLIRLAVIRNPNFNDQAIISDFVKNTKDNYIRARAIEGLKNQELIADIFKNVRGDYRFRSVALGAITDQNILFEIAQSKMDWITCRKAAKKITDQKLLVIIAKTHWEMQVRRVAIRKLIDKKVLADIALNDKEEYVRKDAIKRLKELEKK